MRLTAEKLSIDRAGRRIVRNVSFSLEKGGAMTLVGPNGAGKSTLLRAIAGLLPLAEGRIALEGCEDVAVACHYVGHSDGMKPQLTAVENLLFWGPFLGGGGLSPLEALELFGIAHAADFPVAYLSAGQKRRVALSRLFVAPRPLWLLDEPTTALDVRSQAALAAQMARHRAAGGMIVAATHAQLGLEGASELRLAQNQPGALRETVA